MPAVDIQSVQDDSGKDEPSGEVRFRKTQLEYISKLYDREIERQSQLEDKGKWYLTFITTYVTALYLSVTFLGVVNTVIFSPTVEDVWRWLIGISLAALGATTCMALYNLFRIVAIREYASEYTFDAYDTYFVSGSPRHHMYSTETSFLESVLKDYTFALEQRYKLNEEKSRYVREAARWVAYSLGLLVFFISTIVPFQAFFIQVTKQ